MKLLRAWALAAALTFAASPVLAAVAVITSGTSWVSLGSITSAECLGPGGNGAAVDYHSFSGRASGGGGGGGEYRKVTGAPIANTGSGSLAIQIGAGGSGNPTFLKDNTGTIILQCNAGSVGVFDAVPATAPGGTGGVGAAANFDGGAGGAGENQGVNNASQGGGGGGGAGGPNGTGGAGGSETPTTAGGAGGGGANGGSAGASGTGGNAGGVGGNNRSGVGGEASNTQATIAGAASGGGAIFAIGRPGVQDTIAAWTGGTYGPGAGASGPGGGLAGDDAGATNYGAGGSGSGSDFAFSGAGGAGTQGLLIITYTPGVAGPKQLLTLGVGND